ncbi:ABC transporter [Streptomyces ferrugineus]|uniref:ABC transporter n=1 Tax=Streptomyces ferrugineus TaxID=1413221 RepID=A0A7M2SP81_9ACTN|nr:ABC transporter [Streptomyces ferrugineus]QOV37278.1 ABC transporter [Streptomyces ferrugineus]
MNPSRGAVLRTLLGPDLRATRTLPLLGAGVVGVVGTACPVLFSAHVQPDAAAVLLRIATVLTAIGLACLLDDPAARTTEVVPVSRGLRSGLRMAVGLLLFGLFWGASASLARLGVAADARQLFPVGGLAVEGVTLAVGTLALALFGVRRSAPGAGSLVAAPALTLFAVAALFLPHGLELFPVPGDPDRSDAALRWAVLLVLALIGCAAQLRDEPRLPRGRLRHPPAPSAPQPDRDPPQRRPRFE